ncbi:MAG: toll/interleukin-1 receptor domain-containing protein, partial [Clostridiales bacterium]|nr:toll/interleukin-1 receptor domain-containing protein [Clostridiales bacterium]
MIDHYDAFISYKHAPLDSKIADHVQKNLEHFRIPDKIRQKTGKKKIERVFLDKDELPITADLSETISNALKSAEFLIVICSPETKKSVWVQREIEFFLEHHSRNNVLTVLVDGEPFEVIPEILLKEERTVTDEEGREHKVTIDLEPLSCDYRLPINTAKKKELPRLASAIIGCSYDELMDRNRQYRMRRMALIFGVIMSLGIALTVYMFITQAQIKENLLAAKRSRALYLANESTRLYNEMRRIDAIQLALAALPQDNEFDVIPEAERALADSTLAYQPCVGNSIEATWNYNMPHEIRYIGVSPDRETFAAADIGNHVTMWDTETHDVILDTTYGSQIVGIRHLNNDYLAVWSSRNATVYSTSDGEELWDMEFDTSLVHGGYEFSLEYDEKDERLFLLTYEPKLIALDGATGEMVIDCELDYDRDSLYISYEKLEISPSGDRLMAFYKIDGESYIGVVDLDTGEKIEIPVEGVVNNIGWGDDDHILIQTSEEDIGSLSNSDDFSIVRLISTTLICYDSSDLSEVWRNDFSYSDRSLYSGFFPLPARDAVMYYNSDRAIVYNIDTGDII